MPLSGDDKDKLDYFQKHALPWQIEHMKFRAIGLQVFIPIQGVLFGAWHLSNLAFIAWFGIASCLYLFLWDERTRFIIGKVHEWGRQIADKHFFPLDKEGNPTDGVHVVFGGTLKESGRLIPPLRAWKSHTVAIRILLLTATVIWILILLGRI
jgi:hypothetical protein